jgi:hypothetical protein
VKDTGTAADSHRASGRRRPPVSPRGRPPQIPAAVPAIRRSSASGRGPASGDSSTGVWSSIRR